MTWTPDTINVLVVETGVRAGGKERIDIHCHNFLPSQIKSNSEYERRFFLEGAVNEFAKCIPLLLKEGGCAINKMLRSHLKRRRRGGRSRTMFQNAFRLMPCERPPWPCLFGTGHSG